MKKLLLLVLSAALLFPAGCALKLDGNGMVYESYKKIGPEQAREMMRQDDSHIIVDVRRQDEYDAGHIPGAILIPNESIGDERPEELPDPDQIILIYCRSGNRSKQAAQKLFDMGYKNIYEFGGIIDWKGPIVTTEQEALVTVTPTLVIEANGEIFYAAPEDNPSAKAFLEKLSSGQIEVRMRDYGGFEKVGPLPWSLPRTDSEITTKPGDVILYQGNQITIYYDQNTWNFTRLAKIDSATRDRLLEAFGSGDVAVTFRVEWSE